MVDSEAESSSAMSRSPSDGDHYLAKCVIRGSVLQAVQGQIRSPSSNDVVFGKETSLELVTINEDGTVLSICEQPVFGIIKDLAVLPWNEKYHGGSSQMSRSGKDLLVVTSDSGKLSFLAFSNEIHSGCFIAASTYEDRVSMFSISSSVGAGIINKSIDYTGENEEDTSLCGTILSMFFISKDRRLQSTENNPILPILLARRGPSSNDLILSEWNFREQDVCVISKFAEPGPLAQSVVEVPHYDGFAILFRTDYALLMDLRDTRNPRCVDKVCLNPLPTVLAQNSSPSVVGSALLERSDMKDDGYNSVVTCKYVCSWSWERCNGKNQRMIFCVDSGELFMIEISSDSNSLIFDLSECLYKGQPCKALLWVDGGYLAAIVNTGDGMVLKFEDRKLVHRSDIQNIAPILDVTVMDHLKQDKTYACCGKAPEGSLRIIRGISVESLMQLPLSRHNWYLDIKKEIN